MFLKLFPRYAGRAHRGATVASDHLRGTAVVVENACAFYLFIRQPHGSEVSPAARNTLDSARIPRASKLLIYRLFQEGRVLAQDAVTIGSLNARKVGSPRRCGLLVRSRR